MKISPLDDDQAWAMFYRDQKPLGEIATALNCTVEELKPITAVVQAVVDDCIVTMNRLRSTIEAQRNAIDNQGAWAAEQDKMMENLIEALDHMTGRKNAEREAANKAKMARFSFRKNESYLGSLKIGLREFWRSPLALVRSLKLPLVAVVGGLIGLVVGSVGWLIISIGILGAALTGYISPPKIAK